jgi:hypothetical protein
MVRFSGKYIDFRKSDMIPSAVGGKEKSPVSRGFKT